MGDTGPCGPCTEVFYDHGEHIWGGLPGTPEEDGDRLSRFGTTSLCSLTAKKMAHLKNCLRQCRYGMGLERISAIMQGVRQQL